jgi:DNA-binding transcriptional ArsR family regulator
MYLLAQGEHSVETLSAETDMSVTLTASHLQALRRARLVDRRHEGPRNFYRLAGDDVYQLLTAPRTVSHDRLTEVGQVVRASFGGAR